MDFLAEKDWVGVGKQWADVPPRVKRTVALILTIPDAIHQQLLPSKNLSIHQLVDFTIPKGAAVLSTASSLDYFCHNPPDLLSESSLSKMKRLPMPSASVTKKLVVDAKQAWFPLWLITFWSSVHELRTDVRDPWVKAKAWLAKDMIQKRSATRRALAEDINILLASLPWGMKKSGVSDEEPIHTMWRYLGPNFTTGSQQNDLLEILCARVATNPELVQRLRVEEVALSNKLVEAVTAGTTSEEYKTQKGFAWVRGLGEGLVACSQTTGHWGHRFQPIS